MALSLKISVQSYDRGNHIITMSDDTGVYNVTTNPTGYGAPNEERANLPLILSVKQKDSTERIQWGNPITDTSLTFDFLNDGVYNIYLCAIEFEAGAYDPTLMSLGRVFYSVLDDKVYKVVQGSSTYIVEETCDVYDNSLYRTTIIEEQDNVLYGSNYLVTSYAEQKKREFWAEEMGSCFTCLSREYIDLVKCIELAECYFSNILFKKSNQVIVFAKKILKR